MPDVPGMCGRGRGPRDAADTAAPGRDSFGTREEHTQTTSDLDDKEVSCTEKAKMIENRVELSRPNCLKKLGG